MSRLIEFKYKDSNERYRYNTKISVIFSWLSARDMWADNDMHVKVDDILWDISRESCKGIRIRARM